MRLRSQQAHVSAARLATSAAAHNRATWAAGTDDEETDTDDQQPLGAQPPYSQLLLTQHPEGNRQLHEQHQALTFDELQDARRLTAAATRQWRSDDQRLAQLKRNWPFDPRPDRTVSAVEHARRGTFGKLLQGESVPLDAAKAEASPALAGTAPEAAPAHDSAATAPPAASVAAASAADSVTEQDTDDTDSIQRPQKRIRKKPTDWKREELGLPPRPPLPQGTWTCINMRRTLVDSVSQPAAPHLGRLVQCARQNSAGDPICKACGAARWDGDDGQLAARVSAILQTSDLATTSLSGVLQRLEAESGSAPDAGLQFARADVKREVDRQLSLRARRAQLASSAHCAVEGRAALAPAAQPSQPPDESLVTQAAARLHSSIALLAQQQASNLALRRRAAARALPRLHAAADAGGAAAGAAAAGWQQDADAGRGGAGASAAGDATAAAAAGLDGLLPWPRIPEEAGAAAEEEAVDVSGHWERGPGLAGILPALQGGDTGGEEAADAAASAASAEQEDLPQLRAATQHGCNFAVTLLETILHRKCSQPPSITPLVMRHLLPDRKFMGIPVAAGASDQVLDSDSDSATAQPANILPLPTNTAAAAALSGLRSAKSNPDGRRPPLLLNPWPSGETAAPLPAARTLPASTLNAVLSGLPHYSSRLDELPKSWFRRQAEHQAENGTGPGQATRAAAAAAGAAASSGAQHQQRQHQAAVRPGADASDTANVQPADRRSVFTATGAPGQPPPRPAHEGAGWRRQAPWVPPNLYCVPKRSGTSHGTTFWYEDSAHPSRYGSLHKFTAPPGLPVSAVAQRREETLDALESQLAALPPDVRAVFAAAAEMGLPSELLADVVRRYEALQPQGQQRQQLGRGSDDQTDPSSEEMSDVSDTA